MEKEKERKRWREEVAGQELEEEMPLRLVYTKNREKASTVTEFNRRVRN